MPSPRAFRDKPEVWVRDFYPAFNGLRALAIVLVFCRHYLTLFSSWKIFWAGWVGVDLFFVLSGFLITGILYDSLEQPAYFLNFYVRRSLRIFPLFYAVFLLFWIAKLIGVTRPNEAVWSYALYVGNITLPFSVAYGRITTGICNLFIFNHTVALTVTHFWSLCVEEQFYLVWPLVIFSVRSRRSIMRICAFVIVLVPLLRAAFYQFGPPSLIANNLLYSATLARCDTLLMGAFVAVWLRGAKPSQRDLRTLSWKLGGISLLLLVVGVAVTIKRWPYTGQNPFLATIGFSLVGLFMVAVLLQCLDPESFLFKVASKRSLASLGVVSYGFYVFHDLYRPFVMQSVLHHCSSMLGRYLAVAVVFCATSLLAVISFHFYEAPFLRLKRFWAPARNPSFLNAGDKASPTSRSVAGVPHRT